jgi:hypothetical protein
MKALHCCMQRKSPIPGDAAQPCARDLRRHANSCTSCSRCTSCTLRSRETHLHVSVASEVKRRSDLLLRATIPGQASHGSKWERQAISPFHSPASCNDWGVQAARVPRLQRRRCWTSWEMCSIALSRSAILYRAEEEWKCDRSSRDACIVTQLQAKHRNVLTGRGTEQPEFINIYYCGTIKSIPRIL